MNSLQKSLTIESREECMSSLRLKCKNVQETLGDCLPVGYESTLSPKVRVHCNKNDLVGLKEIWDSWNEEKQEVFCQQYGDIAYLIDVKTDDNLICAMIRFWDPSYRCFVFNEADMVPTVEEYLELLHLEISRPDKVFWKRKKSYRSQLAELIGCDPNQVDKITVRKGQDLHNVHIPGHILQDLIREHPDDGRDMIILALAIYGLNIFPKAIGYVDVQILDFIDQIKHGANPAPTILAETIRSLNFVRQKGEGRFIGCVQLLYVWMKRHMGCLKSEFKSTWNPQRAPLREFNQGTWLEPKTVEEWVAMLSTMTHASITWRAPSMSRGSVLFSCGENFWVPLIGIWGVVSYSSLMVLRQFGYDQFIPPTFGLNQIEFSNADAGFWKNVEEVNHQWRQITRMSAGKFTQKITPEYVEWQTNRAKDIVIFGPGNPKRKYRVCDKERQTKIQKLELELARLNGIREDDHSLIEQLRDELETKSHDIHHLEKENETLTIGFEGLKEKYDVLQRGYRMLDDKYHRLLQDYVEKKDSMEENLQKAAIHADGMNKRIENLKNSITPFQVNGDCTVVLLDRIQQDYKRVPSYLFVE